MSTRLLMVWVRALGRRELSLGSLWFCPVTTAALTWSASAPVTNQLSWNFRIEPSWRAYWPRSADPVTGFASSWSWDEIKRWSRLHAPGSDPKIAEQFQDMFVSMAGLASPRSGLKSWSTPAQEYWLSRQFGGWVQLRELVVLSQLLFFRRRWVRSEQTLWPTRASHGPG